MTISSGTRLGSYEIIGAIGAGGMGEVYRARDTKLHRDVAIKILPELFADDPDRLARFEREAQSLAALNHPNIAQVHGQIELPPEGGSHSIGLVMELVEGEDLSERIARGPIPIAEVLSMAKQIADALDAAHERGIVHRDLKPANIKVRDDGTVKVLDFGLAKAIETSTPDLKVGPAAVMNSPTFTSPVMTDRGLILGTAAYMAPEQARGKPVDKRADIWAFGVIVFEMLTGRQLFVGETVSDLLAAVLREDIRLETLPAGMPVPLRRMLDRCLQKDPRRRLRDIGDARLEIEDAIAGKDAAAASPGSAAAARASRMPWIATALAIAALAGAAAGWALTRGREAVVAPRPPVRFELTPAAGVTHVPNVALAADASFIVYGADAESETSLYVHRFDSGALRQVPGTNGARWPFISPDGKWVGFFRSGKLQKISLDGGDALTLCDAAGGPGAVWLPDGRIVFGVGWLTGLSVVSKDGGKPSQLTTPDAARGEKGHWWPALLPDGRLLFTVFMAGAGLNDNRIAVLNPTSGQYQALFAGAKASWLPSGHILFYRAGRYQVVPFDLDSTRALGDPALVLDDATDLDPAGDWPQPVVVSATGTLAYVPGRHIPDARLVWISAEGRMTPLPLPVRPYVNVALSPRGDQAALSTLEGGKLSLRLADLVQGIDTALDLDGMNWDPVWHSDGRRLSFTSMRKGDFDVFMKDVTTAEREAPVVDDAMDSSPSAWTSDGRLVFQASDLEGVYTLNMVDPRSPAAITRLTRTRTERSASVSPDGKWLAFVAPQEGGFRVYVQRFPGSGPAVQVSLLGADNPYFRPQGRELYLRRGPQLIAMSWEEKDGRFVTSGERVVAKVSWTITTFHSNFGVTADGRVLAVIAASEPVPPRINVVLNWADSLRAR